MFFTYSGRNSHFDQYKRLKKIVKKFPTLWKFLTWLKDRLIDLSRLIDVLMMMILFHFWPEQTYRFSTRKFLPTKKNRLSKESRTIIPYDLVKSKSSNIPIMKEITVIGRGSSFNLNNIKEINGPVFLVSFWSPLKIDDNGNVFYKERFSYGPRKYKESRVDVDYITKNFNNKTQKEFKKENITYQHNRKNIIEEFIKNGHNVFCLNIHTRDQDGNLRELMTKLDSSHLNLVDHVKCKCISLEEKFYKTRPSAPHPGWASVGSFLTALCALSYFAEKINVYGWDFYLDRSPKNMNYWQLFFSMYDRRKDLQRSMYHFECSLMNFYYGYQFSKLPNYNIHGYMGQLGKHEKLIKRIEKVLFN